MRVTPTRLRLPSSATRPGSKQAKKQQTPKQEASSVSTLRYRVQSSSSYPLKIHVWQTRQYPMRISLPRYLRSTGA